MFVNSSIFIWIENFDHLIVGLNIFHLVELKILIKAMTLVLKFLIVYIEHLKLNML